MTTINVHQAKTHLSELLARVEEGEEFVLARAGQPVARLVAFGKPAPRTFGALEIEVPGEFFEPLPDAELAAWE